MGERWMGLVMMLIGRYREEVEVIRGLIKPIVDEYYPNKLRGLTGMRSSYSFRFGI